MSSNKKTRRHICFSQIHFLYRPLKCLTTLSFSVREYNFQSKSCVWPIVWNLACDFLSIFDITKKNTHSLNFKYLSQTLTLLKPLVFVCVIVYASLYFYLRPAKDFLTRCDQWNALLHSRRRTKYSVLLLTSYSQVCMSLSARGVTTCTQRNHHICFNRVSWLVLLSGL